MLGQMLCSINHYTISQCTKEQWNQSFLDETQLVLTFRNRARFCEKRACNQNAHRIKI